MFDLDEAVWILLDEGGDPDIAAFTMVELHCWIHGPKNRDLLEAGRAFALTELLYGLSHMRSKEKEMSKRKSLALRMLRLIDHYRKVSRARNVSGPASYWRRVSYSDEIARAGTHAYIASQVIWFSYVFSKGKYVSRGGNYHFNVGTASGRPIDRYIQSLQQNCF